MTEVILETVLDIVKTVPILFVVYLIVGWMETRADSVVRLVTTAEPLSPLIGALVGAIPQCGFSVGCSALYCRGFLGPAALIAVFLSTSDEAIPVLDKYLDDAYLAHLPSVRIVHGKGTGALRSAVHSHLKRQRYVKSYRLGESGEGDAGVTIASFE